MIMKWIIFRDAMAHAVFPRQKTRPRRPVPAGCVTCHHKNVVCCVMIFQVFYFILIGFYFKDLVLLTGIVSYLSMLCGLSKFTIVVFFISVYTSSGNNKFSQNLKYTKVMFGYSNNVNVINQPKTTIIYFVFIIIVLLQTVPN